MGKGHGLVHLSLLSLGQTGRRAGAAATLAVFRSFLVLSGLLKRVRIKGRDRETADRKKQNKPTNQQKSRHF